MRTYKRVTLEDRIELKICLDLGLSKVQIAQRLGFHKSTITREIKRNSSQKYFANKAHKLAVERFKRCQRKPRLQNKEKLYVEALLEKHWSPEQISGRLKQETAIKISHETIYRHIRKDKKESGILWTYLRRPPRKGKGRYKVRNYKPAWMLKIKERPQAINNRERFGDWERDTMYGLNRKGGLLVCVDRKSRYTRIKKFSAMRPHHVGELTLEALKDVPVLSITNDNGTEFRDFYLHSCPLYFCDPHKPQQRGTVENTIGLLRQFVTNKTDMNQITDQAVAEMEAKFNLRPRKILDYKTPYEIFHKTSVALVS